MKNEILFKRRILGLASYFRSAQEQLMPKYDAEIDFKKIEIPMSDVDDYEIYVKIQQKSETS